MKNGIWNSQLLELVSLGEASTRGSRSNPSDFPLKLRCLDTGIDEYPHVVTRLCNQHLFFVTHLTFVLDPRQTSRNKY